MQIPRRPKPFDSLQTRIPTFTPNYIAYQESIMSCFLFSLPRAITSELFGDWFTLKDITRLDSSCSSMATRAQYIACISAHTLVLKEVRVDNLKFLEYARWLNVRSASVTGLSVPALFLKEGSDDLVSAKNVTRLKKLELNDCTDLSDNMFKSIVKNCKYLAEVRVGNDHHLSWVTDKSLIHLSQATMVLKKFQLTQNASVSDEGITLICEANKGLLDVELRNCSNVGDRSLLALTKFCPALQVLKFVNKNVIAGTGLTALLSNCPDLRELVLCGCSATLPDLKGSPLKNLTSLDLGNFPDGVDLRLGRFLSHTPALRTLGLHDLKSLTDDDLLALKEDFSQLTSLRVESCPRVSALGLEALLGRCPALQELSMLHCGVTQALVGRLVRICSKLETLSLAWCAEVTDAALALLLAQHPLPPLAQLNLNGCVQVTNVTVRALAAFVPTLKRLCVCYCPKVSAEVVEEVPGRHPELQIVHLPTLRF